MVIIQYFLIFYGSQIVASASNSVFERLIPQPTQNDQPCDKNDENCVEEKLKQVLLEEMLNMPVTIDLDHIAPPDTPNESDKDLGDIQLVKTVNKTRVKRKTLVSSAKRWPKKRILYYIAKKGMTSDHVIDIKKGISFWEENTCLRFVPRSRNSEEHYLLFKVWDKLHAETGLGYSINFRGYKGFQDLNLPKNAKSISPSLVAHELGHTIGLAHEHTRKDRNNYVTINVNNIISGNTREFLIITEFGGTTAFGLPYDYASIMHYPQNRLSQDAMLPTMDPVDQIYGPTLGSSSKPTYLDFMEVNIAYGCLCSYSNKTCSHGGSLDIHNCSRCACPEGFGGELCETVEKSDQGAVVEAQFEWTEIKRQIVKDVNSSNVTKIVWLIQAEKGKQIELKLEHIRRGIVQSGLPLCNFDYLQLKTGKYDWRTTGYRLCSPEQRGIYRSAGQVMVVIANVELYALEFIIQYRYVDQNIPPTEYKETATCPHSKVTVSPAIKILLNDLWYGPQIQKYIQNYQTKCGGPFSEIIMDGNRYGISVTMKGCIC